MKKTTFQSNEKANLTKTFIILTLFFMVIFKVGVSQERKSAIGIAATSSITGIGFGTQYSPTVFYSYGRKRIAAGPVFQKRSFNMTGFRVNYEYTVFDGAVSGTSEYNNERLELFFFTDAIYHNSAQLGNAQMRVENQVRKAESTLKFADLTYKATEMYGGFGLRIKLTNKLKWANSVGLGGWYTISGEKKLDREYNASGLMFRTNLSYQF